MAQSGYTPIQLYRTTTVSAAPTAGNLADGELAINTADGKLFYKDSSSAVQVIGWKTVPASAGGTGQTSLTANNVILGNGTSAVQFVAPGTNGNVLTSNGTTWTSAVLPPGGLTYVFTTTPITLTDKQGALTDTSGGAFTVTLPATPATGAQVVVADAGSNWGTNNLTVGRNGSTIGGLAQDLVCDITGASVQLVYDGTTWEVYAQIGGNGGNAATQPGNNAFTGANTFYNSSGQVFGTGTSTQDGIILAGRAGGSSSYRVTLTPTTLTASRTVTLPDADTTIPVATQVLTFSGPTAARTITLPDENFTVGFRNLPAVGTKTGSYTLAVGDVGKYVQLSTGGAIVIPTSTFAEGDAITLYNNTTGNITITCSAPTAYIAGTNTVKTSMTLATRGVATILFYSATACVVSGNVT